jgi:D-glycero-D-manno-heptose 1,7-bisphosphate phosphatase
MDFKIKKALCLDFDGTIRRSKKDPKGFLQGVEDIELMPGIEEKIMQYKNEDFLILGITNQGGVAFGFKTEEDNEAEISATLKQFKRNPFDLVAYSYQDAKGTVPPYNYRSLLRKPGYGMLAVMEEDARSLGYIIDWDNSLFVGDRPEDEECARAAGIPFNHIDIFLNK